MAEPMLLGTSEEWKSVPFAPNYEVSNLGQVRSYWIQGNAGKDRLREYPNLLKQKLGKKGKGYLDVGFTIDGKRRTFRVNRLVALLFVPNPENKPQVNHRDGVKVHNSATNLEWATRSENTLHAHRTGLAHALKGSAHPNSILSDERALKIRQEYWCPCVAQHGRKRTNCQHGNTITELAVKHNVGLGTVNNLVAGRTHYVGQSGRVTANS